MLNKFVAIGLGAVIALAPLAAVAQTEQLAQAAPATPAPAARAREGHRDTWDATAGRAAHHSPPETGQPATVTLRPPRQWLRELIHWRALWAGRESNAVGGGLTFAAPLILCLSRRVRPLPLRLLTLHSVFDFRHVVAMAASLVATVEQAVAHRRFGEHGRKIDRTR